MHKSFTFPNNSPYYGYELEYDPQLGFSLKPPKWMRTAAKKVVHATAVNVKNLGAGVQKAAHATAVNAKNLGKYAGKVWDYTPSGIAYDAIKGNKNPILHAVTVNAKNAKKELKKISINKIVDSLTPEPMPLDTGDTGQSGLMKWLPIGAAAVGSLMLLMGEK